MERDQLQAGARKPSGMIHGFEKVVGRWWGRLQSPEGWLAMAVSSLEVF